MYAPVELTRPANTAVAVETENPVTYIAQTGTGKGAGDAAARLVNAAGSVAAPLVQTNANLAPGLVGGVHMKAAESPELVRYQIQMLELYKSEVLDPLSTLAAKRQQVPDLLRQQIADLADQYAQLLPKLNEKLAKTTARASALQALPIDPGMPTVDQFASIRRACDNLSSLEVQLQNTKKLSLLAQDPVVKARQFVVDLQGISGRLYSQLEVQLALEVADQASQDVPKNLRNQAIAAHIQSLTLLESLANNAPIDPEALRQFKKGYLDLVRQTLGKAESVPTLNGLEEYFGQGLKALGDSPVASTVQGLSQELAQCKRMNSITLKLLQLLASNITAEKAAPLLNSLQDDLTLNTQTSPQLHALLAQHPKRLVKALAPLGLGQTSAEITTEARTETATEADTTANLQALAQRYPKVLAAPFISQVQDLQELTYIAKHGRLSSLKSYLRLSPELLASARAKDTAIALARECAKLGKSKQARHLVAAFGLDVEQPDGSKAGITSFLKAAKAGDIEELDILYALGADLNAVDRYSNDAFHLASCFANPITLRKLRNELGFTNLEKKGFSERTPFLGASEMGNILNMFELDGMGAESNAVDHQSNNALHLAACFADPDTLRVLYEEFDFTNLEEKGFEGRTPFLGAATRGNLANLLALEAMGADIHAQDDRGRNALNIAQLNNAKPEVIEYLQSIGVTSIR